MRNELIMIMGICGGLGNCAFSFIVIFFLLYMSSDLVFMRLGLGSSFAVSLSCRCIITTPPPITTIVVISMSAYVSFSCSIIPLFYLFFMQFCSCSFLMGFLSSCRTLEGVLLMA